MVNTEGLTSKWRPLNGNDKATRGAIYQKATRDVPNDGAFLCQCKPITTNHQIK